VETSLGFSLDDIVKPVVSTMGVKMLRKMGWRDGQGVGPKIKRKLRNLKAKIAHGKNFVANLSFEFRLK
jgi:hypothetical protein